MALRELEMETSMRFWQIAAPALCVLATIPTAFAQAGADTVRKIEEYRQALAEGNPAE